MSEIISGKLHRSLDSYVDEHGVGGLALVSYVDGGFDLVVVDVDTATGDPAMLPLAGPPIDGDVDYLVNVESMTLGVM